jgi:Na+-translocating ferredoxin:NAD+ oxidoreductase RNF subunit RnfB
MSREDLVQPLYERDTDAVAGAFYVIKGQCLLCALPPETAPENISWDEQFQRSGCVGCPNHCRVEKQPETPEELERIIEAACGSCIEAIRYCGTDPKILAKFRESGNEKLCDAIVRARLSNKSPEPN